VFNLTYYFRKDLKSLKIRVGKWDTQSAYEFFPHQDRLVVDAIIHEQYFPAALFNDVALLFLAEPVDLGPEADVCLPRSDQVFDGSRCLATGWGKNQFGMQQIPLIHFQMIIIRKFL
jgi:kallikrein